jgi:hypothetical protein
MATRTTLKRIEPTQEQNAQSERLMTTPSHWLIGVRANELDAKKRPQFVNRLKERVVDALNNAGQTFIRRVTDPQTIQELRARHGEAYVEFYYIDDSLLKAGRELGVTLHPLELVFGPVDHAEIYAAVSLPEEKSRKRLKRAS